MRKDRLCLNGAWQFEVDQGDSGLERGLLTRPLAGHINVPFCPESPLSGVETMTFWYRRAQEQNGIHRFDRSPKFDMERIRAAQQRAAAA